VDDHLPTATIEPSTNHQSESLAERMDLSIGEASTVIGSVLTELMRRSLRGGVMQIGEQLHDYVGEKVDATIKERTEVIEQVAVEVADKTARTAATEVAKEEVQFVARRADELGQQLTGKIELAEKKAELATASATMELSSQVKDAEKRAVATAHDDAAQQLEQYRDKARQGVVVMKGRVKRLDAALQTLTARFSEEQNERQATEQHLRQELSRAVETAQAQARVEQDKLRQHIDELTERIAELERPSGLSRFLSRLAFWRKKQ
jgi:chromosome segregation ATPase